MTVAVLLRLFTGTQAKGRFAGHLEIVDTGATEVFKDQEEMLAILARIRGGAPAGAPANAFAAPPDQPEALPADPSD